ncbi:MAG: hypothetical protein ACRCXK_08780 [Wohlfahrtiimonas sp.]
MTPEQIEFYQEVARTHEKTKYGQQSKYLKSIAETLGISIHQLYENLKKVGYESNRKIRADKGDTHVDLRDARLVCNEMHQSKRANDKRLMSCENAIEIAFANGQIKQRYNPATLLKVAREHGFHPDQLAMPTPHIQMRSLHPNHVWQVDASVGVLFYLPAGGVAFFDEKKHYKNKPEYLEKTRNHLCIRYAVIDHTSGAFFHKYYAATGENQEIFFDVLANAFTQRERESFYGIPQMLVMDKGSANTSNLVINFLEKLQINWYTHEAGNPRAKGSAEKIQDIIECQFESGLRQMHTAVRDADHLNELATEWRIYFNECKIHSRTKRTRYEVWQQIKEDQLIIAPSMEIMRAVLSSKPEARKVRGDLTITFRGKGFAEMKTYRVDHIPMVKNGDELMVTINPYRAPNIDVALTDYKGIVTLYECKPIDKDEFNFASDAPVFGQEMRAPIDTVTDTHRKEMMMEAYGTETQAEAQKRKDQNSQTFGGKLDPMKHVREHLEATSNIQAMPKRGTALDLAVAKQVLEKITVAEACMHIKAKLGSKYPDDTYSILYSKYPDGIDPLEIDSIADSLVTRTKLKVIGE